jgi:hypothetical protein
MLCGAHQTGSVEVNKRHHTTAVMENMLLSSGDCDKLVKVQGTTIECELYMGSRDHVMFVDAGLLTKDRELETGAIQLDTSDVAIMLLAAVSNRCPSNKLQLNWFHKYVAERFGTGDMGQANIQVNAAILKKNDILYKAVHLVSGSSVSHALLQNIAESKLGMKELA